MNHHLEKFTALAILLMLAIFFRFPLTTSDWPFRFCQEVQLTSALAARNLWLTHYKKDLTKEESKWLELKVGRFVEPPVLQHLTAFTYQMAGKEVPWVSGLFGSLFWLLGGWFLYQCALLILREKSYAIVALGFYLLTPYAILLSMSFQPESLLVLGFLLSLLLLLKYPLEKSWTNAIGVSLVCGFAALAKPGLSLIPLVTVCFALNGSELKKSLFPRGKQLFFYSFVPLPSIAYMLWRHFAFTGFELVDGALLGGHVTLDYWEHLQLLPTLPSYVLVVVGLPAFCAGLFAVLYWKDTLVRRVYFGLLAGYLGNVIVFVHALRDFKSFGILASYYHWPLIPLTAFGLSWFVRNMATCIHWSQLNFGHRIVFFGAGIYLAVVLALPARQTLNVEAIPNTAFSTLINHYISRGEKAIVLSDYMAQDIRFFSWLQTQTWNQETDFRRLITEEKYNELAWKITELAEKKNFPYLILVSNGSRPVFSYLSRKFSKVPTLVNVPNLTIYDLGSMRSLQKPMTALNVRSLEPRK